MTCPIHSVDAYDANTPDGEELTLSRTVLVEYDHPQVPPPGLYQHWKGAYYYVFGTTFPPRFPRFEDLQVVYLALKTGEVWTRNLVGPDGWNTLVEKEGMEQPRARFSPVDLGE
jgi:hypothetical protein